MREKWVLLCGSSSVVSSCLSDTDAGLILWDRCERRGIYAQINRYKQCVVYMRECETGFPNDNVLRQGKYVWNKETKMANREKGREKSHKQNGWTSLLGVDE